MTTRPMNTVVILSDEHNRDVLGCYGDPVALTPHLDQLAAQGTVFRTAYCNSPVCVPSRASFMTGRYPHQIGAWDSTSPFDGRHGGWAAQLRDLGNQVVSIGKLHFRSNADDNGFTDEIAPMHVHNGTGWMSSLLRSPPPPIAGAEQMAGQIGPGETGYTRYDRDITQRACDWLRKAASAPRDKPWVLYVGLVAPHFPLIAPQRFFDLYQDAEIQPPRQYTEAERPRHPVLDALRASSNYDDSFDPDSLRIARQAYYGLVSFLDHNIGQILAALSDSGLSDNTRVIYSSDHGDNLGHRGLWGKSVMYDDAVAVPLIIAGPDVPAGQCVDTPVSLVDVHPTLLEFAGGASDPDLPGTPLCRWFETPKQDREVFSEYHDWSSVTGMFMLRTARWKIIRYPGYPDQLFDMQKDPQEAIDLADDPAYLPVLRDMRTRLDVIADIDQINARAFADQQKKIDACGGVDAILAGEEQAYTPAPSQA
ncbi:sulfatase-like hydrolase/transferase [Falsiruegeria mediterranea]